MGETSRRRAAAQGMVRRGNQSRMEDAPGHQEPVCQRKLSSKKPGGVQHQGQRSSPDRCCGIPTRRPVHQTGLACAWMARSAWRRAEEKRPLNGTLGFATPVMRSRCSISVGFVSLCPPCACIWSGHSCLRKNSTPASTAAIGTLWPAFASLRNVRFADFAVVSR